MPKNIVQEKQFLNQDNKQSASMNNVKNSMVSGDIVGRDKIVYPQEIPMANEEDRQSKIKISKVKIKRIIEDLSSSIEEIKKEYFEENSRVAADFNRRNIPTSGIHVKAQMDLAKNTKLRIEKLFTKAFRDIEDILLENFKINYLEEMTEFNEEEKLFQIERNKLSEIYEQFENAVKGWEIKSLGTTQLTKDFKL